MSRLLWLTAALCLFTAAFAQSPDATPLHFWQSQSHYKAIYRVPADSMYQWIIRNTINLQYLNTLSPIVVMPDSVSTDSAHLPLGQYVVVQAQQENVKAHWLQVSALGLGFPYWGHKQGITVYNGTYKHFLPATMLVGSQKFSTNGKDKPILWQPRKSTTATAQIQTAGDTLIVSLEFEQNGKPRRRNAYYKKQFKNWPVVKQIRMAGKKIGKLFDGELSPKQQKIKGLDGFIAFSKPVYKKGDTLRLKAWITNKFGKPHTRPKELEISYRDKGTYKRLKPEVITPTSPGNYLFELVLPDTLPMDTRYRVSFSTDDVWHTLADEFYLEEYTLPDISSFDLNATATNLLRTDTLRLEAEAKDANGINLLDATIEWLLLRGNVENWQADTLFVPDTLFYQKLPLEKDAPTRLKIPCNTLPAVDMDITAIAKIKNSNNETKEKSVSIKLYQSKTEVVFLQEGEWLQVDYKADNQTISAKALLTLENDNWLIDTLIQLPAKIPLHPLAEEYTVEVLDELGRTIHYDSYEPPTETINPLLFPQATADSIGFKMINPAGQTVFFTLTSGSRTLFQTHSNSAAFRWMMPASHLKLYKLSYSYVEAGSTVSKNLNIAIPYKWMQVSAQTNPVVQPGANDTLLVKVTDFKGKPMEGINLTAVAYNEQLKAKTKLPHLPFTQNYKMPKKRIAKHEVSYSEDELTTTALLQPLHSIQQQLGADTMPWYRQLYSSNAITIKKLVMQDAYPEIAVHTYSKGSPLMPVYIEINNMPVFIQLQNSSSAYSFNLSPGYAKVSIRTPTEIWHIDSLYMQPYYKHDVFINLDSLKPGKHIERKAMPDKLTYNEVGNIDKHFIWFESHPDNQNVWVWQGYRIHHLNNRSSGDWVAGPFVPQLPVEVYRHSDYRFQFPKEAGYRYRISQKLVRLQQHSGLINMGKLKNIRAAWRLGETIPDMEMPPIQLYLSKKTQAPFWLPLNPTKYHTDKDSALVQVQTLLDTTAAYLVLMENDNKANFYIANGNIKVIHNLKPGNYNAFLVRDDGLLAKHGLFSFSTNGSNCLTLRKGIWYKDEAQLNYWRRGVDTFTIIEKPATFGKEPDKKTYYGGSAGIMGNITDAISGEPIPGVTIRVQGYNKVTNTDQKGYFELNNLASGEVQLEITSVGYAYQQITVILSPGQIKTLNTALQMVEYNLNEVIVVGYGTQTKRSLTGSITTIEPGNNYLQTLEGKVAGVNVTGSSGASTQIRIRGNSSMNGDAKPLFVVDGILVDELPAGLDTSMGNVSIEVIKGSTATALYGSRAAAGVIVVQTGRPMTPVVRSRFADYAYWQPENYTNRKGEARIPITYPENITGWQHHVFAAAKGGLYGQSSTFTRAFKAVQAQLSVPAFVIEGDSVLLRGKAFNYTEQPVDIQATFTGNGNTLQWQHRLDALGAWTPELPIIAGASPDTLNPVFSIAAPKNKTDGEKRTIPVLLAGTMETTGMLYNLTSADTTVNYTPAMPNREVKIFATNNMIDLLEQELKQLIDYPYTCLEQTANKLWGLHMMEQIYRKTGKTFRHAKQMENLLQKILKNQHESGGWAWWGNGQPNLYITTRILQALKALPPRQEVNQSLRQGYLYLQNNLYAMPKSDKIEALFALARGGHVFPYRMALDSIAFDSLNLHQQWQYYYTWQMQPGPTDKLWPKLWAKRKETATGGLGWGEASQRWYFAPNATQVVAWHTLKKDSSKQHLLAGLKQHLMQTQGGWGNTVERAEISNLLLTDALEKGNDPLQKTTVSVSGYGTIEKFPAAVTINAPGDAVAIIKKGSGETFLTLAQQWQNKTPRPVDSLFAITTLWQQQNKPADDALKTGQSTNFIINVYAKKSAEFVMVEIPLPAGCVVTQKEQVWGQYREYLKDKVLIFFEKMEQGSHKIELPIEVRFSGRFTQNPVKIELMYQPVLFGRNGMQSVIIEGQ